VIIFESFDIDWRGDIENGIPTNRFFFLKNVFAISKRERIVKLSTTKAKYMLES
jgi:hypothetical protein